MPTETEIIARGKADYFSRRGVYNNPYPPSSAEFNHYERGWMQSLKLNDGRLIDASKKPSSPGPQNTQQTNRYAELKGRNGPLRKNLSTGQQ